MIAYHRVNTVYGFAAYLLVCSVSPSVPIPALSFQAIKEIYSMDAQKAKEMAMERRKNGTIEMSAARLASMMDEAGEGEVGGDVPMVKVSLTPVQVLASSC